MAATRGRAVEEEGNMEIDDILKAHPEVRKQARWLEYIGDSDHYGFFEYLKEFWKLMQLNWKLGKAGRHIFLLEDNRKLLVEAIEVLQSTPGRTSHLQHDEVEWRELQLSWLKMELMNQNQLDDTVEAVRNGNESVITNHNNN